MNDKNQYHLDSIEQRLDPNQVATFCQVLEQKWYVSEACAGRQLPASGVSEIARRYGFTPSEWSHLKSGKLEKVGRKKFLNTCREKKIFIDDKHYSLEACVQFGTHFVSLLEIFKRSERNVFKWADVQSGSISEGQALNILAATVLRFVLVKIHNKRQEEVMVEEARKRAGNSRVKTAQVSPNNNAFAPSLGHNEITIEQLCVKLADCINKLMGPQPINDGDPSEAMAHFLAECDFNLEAHLASAFGVKSMKSAIS